VERAHRNVSLIVFSALVAQVLARYHGKDWIVGGSFYALTFVVRLAASLGAMAVVFGGDWRAAARHCGWGRPQASRTLLAGVLALASLLPLLILLLRFDSEAQSYYAPLKASPDKLAAWALFTLSTVPAWELLHRSLLLFGVAHVLDAQARVPPATARLVSVLLVCAFEVLYHLIKPSAEPWALLIASPLFSWLALRTRSVWLPLALHLYVEGLFIALV
jgi:hypothetical protein